MSYHQFKTEPDETYGSFAVFYNGTGADQVTVDEIGWYWWPCFPGCLPESDPIGPFATEAEAIADANAF
jgi:hypothetical protein